MRYIKFLVGMALLLFLTGACQKEELFVYEQEKDQLFFSYVYEDQTSGRIVDSVLINFGYDKYPKADSIIKIPVRVMGAITDYEREFKYKIEEDSVTTGKPGINYEILPSFIPDSTGFGYLHIKVYNHGYDSQVNDPDHHLNYKDSTYVTAVRLIENEHFNSDYTGFFFDFIKLDPLMFRIFVKNDGEMPNLWAALSPNFNWMFGSYSKVKFEFMLRELGLERDYFMYDPETEKPQDVYNARFPMALIYSMIAQVNNALNRYEEEHGERLKDEYGNEVKMGMDYI